MNAVKDRVIEKNKQYVCPDKIRIFNQIGIDLVIGKRQGPYIFDLDGKQLIDVHINGGTYNLGHRHPEIIDAMKEALEMPIDIGNHHFPSPLRGEVAQLLVSLCPGNMKYCVFASGGSEAIDIAIKSARHATQRRKIVSIANGYHGRTGLSGAAGNTKNAVFFLSDTPQDFLTVPFNDINAMTGALANNDIAAVILETIPATLGFPLPQNGYLEAVKSACEQTGTLFIADEVQTGLSRSGKIWAVEKFNVKPDILVTAKGLSGGMYPIAAAILNEKAGSWLLEDGFAHVSTFGGSEIGCHVAKRVLEIISRPETLEHVNTISAYLSDSLRTLKKKYSHLVEVRQCGLIAGLKFEGEMGAVFMSKALYDNGVWAMFSGYDLSVLQFKPYLFTDQALVDVIIEKLEKSIIQCSQ
jgi:acetylornithine/succinyldiaminopimelate/putrescine aminotransferase